MMRVVLFLAALAAATGLYAAERAVENASAEVAVAEPPTEEASGPASPFGIDVGLEPFKLELMRPTSGKRLPGRLVVRSPPRAHPAFAEYLVQFGPTSGVCAVRAFGWLVPDDGTGVQVREVFRRIASPLGHRYGRYIREDAIRPGSAFEAEDEWVEAISTGDRVYFASWSRAEGARMPRGLDAIRLEVVAGQRPAVTLTYLFDNLAACEREIMELQDDVL
jgi:hypothetical protein